VLRSAVVQRVHALVLVTRVERIVGDRRNIATTGSLRVSEGTASSDASDTDNDADDNPDDGSSGENSGNSNDWNSAAISIARGAGTVPAEVEFALISSTVAAVHWDAEATTEGVANIISAQVIVRASDVGVNATESTVANIGSADALIVAEVGGNRSMGATRRNIAFINGARIIIVASRGNILPSADLRGSVADISGAGVTVVTFQVSRTFTSTNAKGAGRANTSSRLARICEASRVRLASNRGSKTRLLSLVASKLLAKIVGVVAVARSRLAANTTDVGRAAESR
jgi:hypothetical protein